MEKLFKVTLMFLFLNISFTFISAMKFLQVFFVMIRAKIFMSKCFIECKKFSVKRYICLLLVLDNFTGRFWSNQRDINLVPAILFSKGFLGI